MPRGRKKKYVRPNIDCTCFYCDANVEQPYIHIVLKRQEYGDKKVTVPAGTPVKNRDLPMEERFKAQIKLAKLPPNSSPSRLHNRCKVTGRPKAFYRKLQMSRIALRDLASRGEIPGMIKSSW